VGPGNEHDRRRLEDRMYDTRAIRWGLRQRGIRAGLPRNPQRGKEIRRGGPSSFEPKGYREVQSSVERFFGWLKGGVNVDGLARKNACYLPGLRLPRLLPRE